MTAPIEQIKEDLLAVCDEFCIPHDARVAIGELFARTHRLAYDDGYDAGYDEGYDSGCND